MPAVTDAKATTNGSDARLAKLGEGLARMSLLDEDSKMPTDRNALVRYQVVILTLLQKLGDAKLELPAHETSSAEPAKAAEESASHLAYAKRVLGALERLLAATPKTWRKPAPAFLPLLEKAVVNLGDHVEALSRASSQKS